MDDLRLGGMIPLSTRRLVESQFLHTMQRTDWQKGRDREKGEEAKQDKRRKRGDVVGRMEGNAGEGDRKARASITLVEEARILTFPEAVTPLP